MEVSKAPATSAAPASSVQNAGGSLNIGDYDEQEAPGTTTDAPATEEATAANTAKDSSKSSSMSDECRSQKDDWDVVMKGDKDTKESSRVKDSSAKP